MTPTQLNSLISHFKLAIFGIVMLLGTTSAQSATISEVIDSNTKGRFYALRHLSGYEQETNESTADYIKRLNEVARKEFLIPSLSKEDLNFILTEEFADAYMNLKINEQMEGHEELRESLNGRANLLREMHIDTTPIITTLDKVVEIEANPERIREIFDTVDSRYQSIVLRSLDAIQVEGAFEGNTAQLDSFLIHALSKVKPNEIPDLMAQFADSVTRSPENAALWLAKVDTKTLSMNGACDIVATFLNGISVTDITLKEEELESNRQILWKNHAALEKIISAASANKNSECGNHRTGLTLREQLEMLTENIAIAQTTAASTFRSSLPAPIKNGSNQSVCDKNFAIKEAKAQAKQNPSKIVASSFQKNGCNYTIVIKPNRNSSKFLIELRVPNRSIETTHFEIKNFETFPNASSLNWK